MGADYSLELISIETYAPQFIGLNKFFLGSMVHLSAGMADLALNIIYIPLKKGF